MKPTSLIALLLLALALLAGCSSGKTLSDPGTQGGACLEGHTCNPPLTCVGNRCVALGGEVVSTTTTATVGYRSKLEQGSGGGAGGDDESCDRAQDEIDLCAPGNDVFGSTLACVGATSRYAKCILEDTELYCAYLADPSSMPDPCEVLPLPDISRGRCSEERGGEPCAGDCAFPSGTLDCAGACTNLAGFCEERACLSLCGGGTVDLEACFAGCDLERAISCTNLVLGCAATSTDCASYYGCLEDRVEF